MILSLGAGVQSSAMLLWALEGRFGDPPDCAVFADTGWEPKAVHEWLEQLTARVAPFPIVTVAKEPGVKDSALRAAIGKGDRGDGRFTTIPYFLRNPDGSAGMARRQCTSEFKLEPMKKYWRSLGATHKNPIESWIGISTDEAHRMKPSQVKYAVNRYPLIEAGIARRDCADYLRAVMGDPPKSACLGCPFHGDAYWARLRAESPEEFEDVCAFDDAIRAARDMRAEQYIHRSLKPLRQIGEFMHETQGSMFEDAFGNECEGLCGL